MKLKDVMLLNNEGSLENRDANLGALAQWRYGKTLSELLHCSLSTLNGDTLLRQGIVEQHEAEYSSWHALLSNLMRLKHVSSSGLH